MHRPRPPALPALLAALAAVTLAACTDAARAPAERALQLAESAVASLGEETERLAPEQARAAREALARARDFVARQDYQGALAAAREVPARVTAALDVARARKDEAAAAAEKALADAWTLSMSINAWEGRWPLNTYARDMDRAGLSQSAQDRLATAEKMTLEGYQKLIAERDRVRRVYAGLKDRFAACIALPATGAAPKGLGSTGDPIFAVPGSLLGTPALSLPVLAAEGLPLGLQLLGFQNEDAALFAAAAAVLPLFEGGGVRA